MDSARISGSSHVIASQSIILFHHEIAAKLLICWNGYIASNYVLDPQIHNRKATAIGSMEGEIL